jgi:diacylglycerol kinase family enzyme
MSWVGIVANKAAGRGQGLRLVRRLQHEFQSRGEGVRIAWTLSERHALVAASAADASCRCLISVGGDGTLASLLNESPRVPVGILPTGTENLVARHFGFGRDPVRLVDTVLSNQVHPIDLGLADGRRFILMAGFGFDGDVVTRHHQTRLGQAGRVRPTHRVAYVEPILRSSLSYRFPRLTVTIEDPTPVETLTGTTVFLFNLPRYALGLPFAPEAREDDGWLDLIIFRDPGPFQALYYLWRVLCRTHLAHPGVTHRRVRRVSIQSDEPVPVQLDGDPGGFVIPDDPVPPRPAAGRSKRPSPLGRSGIAGMDRIEASRGPWTVRVLPSAASLISTSSPPGERPPDRVALANHGNSR